MLRKATGVTFVTGTPRGPDQDAEFQAWQVANRERLEAARQAEREYLAETFAVDTLSGAILQVAGKALEIYGQNTTLPEGLPAAVKATHSRYCVGRIVRTLPLGLVVFAARNQHTHFNDEALREPNLSVFQRLATAHSYGGGEPFADPAFDLSNPRLVSYAGNVTSLIGWRSFEDYDGDMRVMLNVAGEG